MGIRPSVHKLVNVKDTIMADEGHEETAVAVAQPPPAELPEIKLFGRWSCDDVQISDMSLTDYLPVKEKYAIYLPHSAGRYATKRFRKAQCPIVERVTNSLMMHGRNNGKKLMAVRILKHSFEIIHLPPTRTPFKFWSVPSSTLELVKLLSGTLRRLLNVWLMNSSMLPRDHLTRTQSRRRMNLNVSLNPTDNLYWLFCLGCCQIHPI